MDLRDFNPAIKYGASLQNTALPQGKILLGDSTGLAQEKYIAQTLTLGVPFSVTGVLATASGSTTVTLLSDGSVTSLGSGFSVYVNDALFVVSGGTAWNNTTTVTLKDGAGTAFVVWSTGSIVANTIKYYSSGSTALGTVTVQQGGGGTANRGLTVVGDALGTGSPAYITVSGVIK